MNENNAEVQAHEREPTQCPALEIDYDLYLGEIEDWDMTEPQKRELIRTLFGVLISFAELGFGIHAAQNLPAKSKTKTGDNTPATLKFSSMLAGKMLHSDHTQNAKNSAAGSTRSAAPGEERVGS